MRYRLSAINSQGGVVFFEGHTMKECLSKFDSEYTRKGFRIYIEGENGIIKKIVKISFR